MSDDKVVPPEEGTVISEGAAGDADEKKRLAEELKEMSEKYMRLYADFENYKKRVNKDKEELVKYGQEHLLSELLTVVDNLEMALKHASDAVPSGLVQGVEITHRELLKTLEKFGLSAIDAQGKAFDPSVHHAMSHIEQADSEENTVVEEYRKGYKLKDKVLRPSLVAVSKRPAGHAKKAASKHVDTENIEEEES